MIYVLVPIYVIVLRLPDPLLVLLQQGRARTWRAPFGASSSQTTFGARGATTLLEKITTWAFVGFSVLAVAISLIQSHPKSSVLSSAVRQKGGSGRSEAGRSGGARSGGPGESGARHELRKGLPAPGGSGYQSPSLGPPCPGGGIGRRARLRGVWSNPCQFESGPRHQPDSARGERCSPADPLNIALRRSSRDRELSRSPHEPPSARRPVNPRTSRRTKKAPLDAGPSDSGGPGATTWRRRRRPLRRRISPLTVSMDRRLEAAVHLAARFLGPNFFSIESFPKSERIDPLPSPARSGRSCRDPAVTSTERSRSPLRSPRLEPAKTISTEPFTVLTLRGASCPRPGSTRSRCSVSCGRCA